MSHDTREVWAYAKKHNIPYDAVVAAIEMAKNNPNLDIYAVMMNPTDSQKVALVSLTGR